MKHPKFSHAFEVVADLPVSLEGLKRLATNFYWSWDHSIRDLFREIHRELWAASEHNPIYLLNHLPAERAEKLAQDPMFLARYQLCLERLDSYLTRETWFDKTFPGVKEQHTIAYFCAEWTLASARPKYRPWTPLQKV